MGCINSIALQIGRFREAIEFAHPTGLQKSAETITCPVLVIRGAESDALSDEQAAAFAAALPDGRWDKVENAGHTIQDDYPRGLVRVLARFLADIGH